MQTGKTHISKSIARDSINTMINCEISEGMVPFLKWAGGKRWLASSDHAYIPSSYNNYIEPFLGSAAIFFTECPEASVLSDINAELITTYNAIKSDWKKVEQELKRHASFLNQTILRSV